MVADTTQPRLRVVVAEPAELTATVLADALRSVADVTVHHDALDGIDAVCAGADVLVSGPGVAVSALVDVVPALLSAGTRTLVISAAPHDADAAAVLLAGASGFLLDVDASPSDVRDAVQRVASGASALHADVVHTVLAEWRSQRATVEAAPVPESLTTRELDVLRALRDGLTTRQAAARLGVAEKTVEAHKSRLFAKLNVRNQSQAVQAGSRMGLV